MTQLIPVFLYHRVEIDNDPFAVDPDVFASHLQLIAASGRTSLTMSELAEVLRGERPLPSNAVGLTFDDGYADTRATLESAAALGVKSTLYVTTGAIGCPGGITTADVVRLAGSDCVELGAHTVTHPHLDELWSSEAAEEIVASRRALSEITGDAVRSFAYPHGAYSARIRNLVLAAGFDSAAAVKNALSHSEDDPFAIARYTITATTPLSKIEDLLRCEGAPIAWSKERARTRAYRTVRVARRQLDQVRRTPGPANDAAPSATVSHADGIVGIRPPVAVAQIDLNDSDKPVQLTEPREGRPYTAVAVLVRDQAKPLAWTVIPPSSNGLLSRDQLPVELRSLRSSSEVAPTVRETAVGVVVTTCAEAESTVSCIRSLLASEQLPAEIIVVENRPIGSTVAQAVQESFADPPVPIRVIPESQRGLSYARNAGLMASTAEIVAFTDDDITADPYWLGSISRAFGQDPELSCVTGLILPLELETDAQVEFEHFSGLGKGLTARSFSMSMGPIRDMPLFPYAAGHFGSGANAGFKRTSLLELGGFDPLLGAGTRTQGGEDMDIFIRLLSAGGKLTYEPSAIVWHRHPDTNDQVHMRTLSYGVGFGAVVCKLMVSREHRRSVTRLIPSAVAYWFDPRSRKNAHRPDTATSRADQIRETIGIAVGVFAYARSRTLAAVTRSAETSPRPVQVEDSVSFMPIWSGQMELTSPHLPEQLTATDGSILQTARVLVRAAGTPAGFLQIQAPIGRLSVQDVVDSAQREFGERIASGLSDTDWTTVTTGPKVTVALCTHNRAEGARRALESLLELRYENLEILVVDNAPVDDATRDTVAEFVLRDDRVRYVCEPHRGLSRARNHALADATGELLAFIDDDVQVDPLWVQGFLRGFSRRSDIACVTGLVASASLERPSEQYFDRRVWWSSSCEQRLHTAARAPGDSPFHPYASGAFGTGANFVFRLKALRELGGFDQCLGAGSPTRGGEDLDIFVRLLRGGYALSFEPCAVVWHHHRVDDAQLRDQMYAYGLGLSAYLTKLALSSESRNDMLRHGPGFIRHTGLLLRRSRRAKVDASEGPGLARAEVSGLLAGPFAYFRARRLISRKQLASVAH